MTLKTTHENAPEGAARGAVFRRAASRLKRGIGGSHRVNVLRIAPERAVLPADCACCSRAAAESRREVRASDGASLIVPYCSACLWHASVLATRSLAVTLSSVLFAVTLAAALPLLWMAPSPIVYGLTVVGGALLPIVLGRAWPPRRADGHSALWRAVWFLSDGSLACTNPTWSAALGQTAGVPIATRRVREPLQGRWVWSGLGVAFIAVPLFYPLHFPRVRVVNLTDRPLSISADGRKICEVSPTTQESPSAGVVARFPAGERTLRATDSDGHVMDERRVIVRNRSTHLYAPGSHDSCFWLETTAYGRHAGGGREPDRAIFPLSRRDRFWSLRTPVDTWFSPNPTTASDTWSTGGELRALRQARCLEAPAAVRETIRR